MNKPKTFAEAIESEVEEIIEFVVIGDMGWGDDYNSELVPNYDLIPKFKVLSWREARQWLDFETSYGYGAPKQPAIYAYTKSYVIAVSQYDGSTSLFSIPRNPTDGQPNMPGGG